MTEALQVEKTHKVLEIGTGSGYQAAVLSRLARRVYTIERFASLLKEAEARFRDLRIHNITSKTADGAKGWKEQAPFDRIIVTAAADGVPQTLIDQLAEGGIMVVPVGAERGDQVLLRLVKKPDGLHQEILADVRFVPLIGGALPEEEGPCAARGAERALMSRTRNLRAILVVALAATTLAGCNLNTMLASPPAPDPAVPAGAPFGEIKNGQYVVAPGDTVAIVSERTNTPIRTIDRTSTASRRRTR
jgi:protein-L-isoaspartate O-methyltransferase